MLTTMFNRLRRTLAPDSRIATNRYFQSREIVYPKTIDTLTNAVRHNVKGSYLTYAWGEAVKHDDDQYIVRLHEKDKHKGHFQGTTKRTITMVMDGGRQLLTKEEALSVLENHEKTLRSSGFIIDEKQPLKPFHFSHLTP